MVLILVIVPFSICFATTDWIVYEVLNVWSVDSGKHLDWSGSSEFISNFETGVRTWNDYKPGVIRKDSILTQKDITISDVTDFDGAGVALTRQPYAEGGGKSINPTIQFSKTKMRTLSSLQRDIVCTHELGHALGLAENNGRGKNLIMYNNIFDNTSNNILHNIDKVNYDYMYNNKY